MTLKFVPLDWKVSLLAAVAYFSLSFLSASWQGSNATHTVFAFPTPQKSGGAPGYFQLRELNVRSSLPPPSAPFPLYVQSKPRRNQIAESLSDDGESPWIKFKKLVYNGLDGVSAVVLQDTDGSIENNVQKGRIQEGYDSSLEASIRAAADPTQQVWNRKEQVAFRIRQGPPVSSLQQQRRQDDDSKRSSFDSLKAGVYSAVDFVAGPSSTRTRVDVQEQKNTIVTSSLPIPSKPSVNRAAALSEELVLSASNPVQRMQAELEIREQEARARAAVRNEKIRAKKEDLYRIVDSFQASVDALPETFDKTEAIVLEVVAAARTLPERVEKTVQEIQTIPEKAAKKAAETQRSIQGGVEMTQKVVKDVQDIPQNVARSVEETKKSLANTQESVQEAVTTMKVLVGLEKPIPKPPKLPPPSSKSAKEIAADLAGQAALATGKLAWWTGRNTASLVWKGAGVACSKGMEMVGPAVGGAWSQYINSMSNTSTSLSSTLNETAAVTPLIEIQFEKESNQNGLAKPKLSSAGDGTAEKEAIVPKRLTKAELDAKLEEAQALAKEVADALDMAERALMMSNIDDSGMPKL